VYIYTDSHSYAHVASDSFPFIPLYSSLFSRFRMKKWKKLTNSVFLLRCLTQLALCRTVNHEREPHYHSHRKNPRFVLQEHTIGEEWVFKESEFSFRILLLLISPKRFFITEFIAIQLVFVATMNLPFLSISLFIAPSYPPKLAFPALSPSSQSLLLSRKSFL